MTRTITNDVPQALLDVAKDAFALGLGTVRLGFMYMGDDFVSPIQWALWLNKRDERYDEEGQQRSSLVVTAFREDAAPTASGGYGEPSWDIAEITAWMREPLPASGEYLGPWSPVEAGPARDRLLLDWDLFEAGVLSGWIMGRKVLWDHQEAMRRTAARIAENGDGERAERVLAGLTPDTVPTSLDWENSNGYYNTMQHPAYRGDDDGGAPVSVGGHALRNEELGAWRTVETHTRPQPISVQELEAILGATAPWFVRVAGFDEGQDEWVHAPEASAWEKSPEGLAAAAADTRRAIAMSRA